MNPGEPKPVAIITGAAGGIGTAIADKLLSVGFRVCITDKEEGALADLHTNLRSRYASGDIFLHVMDVTRREAILATERSLLARWGAIDVLVNNAGIFQKAPALDIEEEGFQEILNVDLLGTFRTCQIFGRRMIEQRHGKIINIASIAAIRGAPQAAHYAASKAGIVAFSMSLAAEFAPFGVPVNVILPGYIETSMLSAHWGPLRAMMTWRNPGKRLGLPWEVAEVVVFLALAQSSYLTGAQIVIDGGHSLA